MTVFGPLDCTCYDQQGRRSVLIGEGKMARPSEVTPVLKGKDAKKFLEETTSVVVNEARLAWLKSKAEKRKRAEQGETKKCNSSR